MVYFISGHRDLTLEEFEKYYVPKLQRIFEDDSNIKYEFIVGDWGGCDKLFLDYIHNDFITEDTSLPITIVYVDKPRYENIESKHKSICVLCPIYLEILKTQFLATYRSVI